MEGLFQYTGSEGHRVPSLRAVTLAVARGGAGELAGEIIGVFVMIVTPLLVRLSRERRLSSRNSRTLWRQEDRRSSLLPVRNAAVTGYSR